MTNRHATILINFLLCVKLSNFSLKEQMKMEVMGIYTKTKDSTMLKGAMDKCSYCGAYLS